MKPTPVKPGSFRRLLRNLRKESEGKLTPIQALRAKQDKGSAQRREKFRRQELTARDDYFRHIQKVSVEHWAKRNPAKAKPVPAKRSGKALPRASSLRSKQRRQYSKLRKVYLLAHPYCQSYIWRNKLSEEKLIVSKGVWYVNGFRCVSPPSTQIHHRNKANGSRLLNTDYWLAVCDSEHVTIEEFKDVARKVGFLCPINCKPDGTMPDGTKQPTTTELLASRHAAK